MPEQTPTAPSPEALTALKNLEQRQVVQPAAAQTNQSSTPKSSLIADKLKWLREGGLWLKLAIGFGTAVFVCMGVIIIMLLTSFDLRFMKITLAVQVVDGAGNPIEGAVAKLNDIERTTDAQGLFSIGDLQQDRYRLVITHNSFLTYDQEIAVARGFLNYTDARKIVLEAAKSASLKGKFKAPDASYQFIGEKILVDDESFEIKANGTFDISNLKSGKRIVQLQSDDYVDVKLELELTPGINQIQDIELEVAGDIKAQSVSWVRGDVIKEASIEIEGTTADQITISDTGELRVRDLEVGKAYNIRTRLTGYQNRDYVITIEQGINELPQFRFVESGRVPYLRKVGTDLFVYISDYDGANEKQLTVTDLEPYGEFIKDDLVYFLSTRDSIRSTMGGEAFIAYAASINGGNPQRLTTTTTTMGKIYPNFTAAKLSNVWAGSSTRRDERTLEIMDLSGASRLEVKKLDAGTFGDVLISDSGKYVVFYMQDPAHTTDGMYRADISGATVSPTKLLNKRNLLIYSVSADGNRIVYSATNETTTLNDLFIYTVSTGQDKLLKQSYTGSNYQFLRGSDVTLLFQDLRDGSNNAYLMDTNTNQETKITTFRGTEGVEAVYQQSRYVLTQTNLGLYILDATKPVSGRLVTDKAARYTGYDF